MTNALPPAPSEESPSSLPEDFETLEFKELQPGDTLIIETEDRARYEFLIREAGAETIAMTVLIYTRPYQQHAGIEVGYALRMNGRVLQKGRNKSGSGFAFIYHPPNTEAVGSFSTTSPIKTLQVLKGPRAA